jgi:hypothetical protein
LKALKREGRWHQGRHCRPDFVAFADTPELSELIRDSFNRDSPVKRLVRASCRPSNAPWSSSPTIHGCGYKEIAEITGLGSSTRFKTRMVHARR